MKENFYSDGFERTRCESCSLYGVWREIFFHNDKNRFLIYDKADF